MAAPQQNPTINWTSANLAEEWNRFEDHANLMFMGPLKRCSDDEKAAYIRIWIGEQGREIYKSWNWDDDQGKNPTNLKAEFKKHCQPKQNTVFARYLFHQRIQKAGETCDTFVTDLRNLVKNCTYDKPNEMVRDRIVAGISSSEIREKLLTTGDDLTMDSAIEIVGVYEATQQRLKSMATGHVDDKVDAIHQRRKERYAAQSKTDVKSKGKYTSKKEDVDCGYCGRKHKKGECPAFGQTCKKCHKLNHWAIVCRSATKSIDFVEDDSDLEDTDLYVDSIQGLYPDTAFADIKINTGNSIRFKLDSGSQANIIPYSMYKKLHSPPKLKTSSSKLFGYSGQRLTVQGDISLDCAYKGNKYQGIFHVVDTPKASQPILGLSACLKLKTMQLILSINSEQPMTQDNVLEENKHLFSGLGELEGEVTIHLKEGATPTIHSPRRVPHAIKDKLKAELTKMEQSEVITKVTVPTDWVNSLVIVEKPNGKLRICLDPKDLNEAIKRPHYQMPTLEDALAKMSGAKFFTKLDARSGYWQLKLDEPSSFLTTFNTPFGRYRFNRLPFGLNCAQDIFQRKMDELIEGLNGVTTLIDDTVVTGTTREEHDANLKAVLERATEKNLKLNPEKLIVGAQEIEYFGHRITAEGLKPDEKKVKAIQDMPPPVDKKELQTILGMITYLSKFAPHMSDLTKPMRDLLKEESEFIWDEQQQTALQNIKNELTKHPVLSYFDPKKEVTLEVDASKYGLGAVLYQEGKPVAYASKSLTPAEQNYAQIEKELYAILFGCKRFHQYVYGRDIKVLSDHKPLEIIAKKPLTAAPPRLQRMLLQLQAYRLNIVHVPGKSIPVADTLSRKYLPAEIDDCQVDLDVHVHTVLKNLPISDRKMEQVREATNEDKDLHHVKSYLMEGWPDSKEQCHITAATFWTFRDELSIIDGIIMKGEKVFVPAALRPEMLKKIHEGHLGMAKTTSRARQILFWPGMTTAIEGMIASCPTCIPKLPSNPKEPLHPHDITSRPWQKLASDLFMWNGRNFLLTVDYYSRYFEVDELTTTSSASVIRKLSTHFARHGIPELFMSDNGPQYASDEFAEFASTWDFKHITSSPGYPQSNGLAERTVQTVKNILDKAKASGTNPLRAILEYRTTPVDNLASPAELLMGRQLRSSLPMTHSHLIPKTIQPSLVTQQRQHLQKKQSQYYNRSAHPLTPLKIQDPVYVQVNKGDDWRPATIAKQDSHRSYTVKTPEGSMFRRNRRHLRGTPPSTSPSGLEKPPTPQKTAHTDAPPPAEILNQQPDPGNHVTTTRSGRLIRPPDRMDM